jgi:hypothetical protein
MRKRKKKKENMGFVKIANQILRIKPKIKSIPILREIFFFSVARTNMTNIEKRICTMSTLTPGRFQAL